jgi:hypothetical protein
MFKDKFSTIKDILNIILAVIIAVIQVLFIFEEKEPGCYEEYNAVNFVLEHALAIILICSTIIILSVAIMHFVELHTEKKIWLRSVLQEIVDKYLYGNNFHTRITVFVPTRNNKYLKCYARYGYPLNRCLKPKKIPLASGDSRPIGVVGKCFSEGNHVECHADCLDGINFAKTLEKNVPANKKKIKKYMNQTYLSESDYDILVNMNRRSTHFYAYPILSKNTNIWGVMIIDNNQDIDFDFSPIRDVIKSYSNIITLTLKI